MKIVILYSETPETASIDEQDVLVQVDAVSGALINMGYEPLTLPVNIDLAGLIERLQIIQPDLVFNLVESLAGQDRLIHIIPSILDSLNIPYTGASTESIFLTSNKILAKKALKAKGIPTPEWLSIEEDNMFDMVNGAYIIKSVWDHASKGIDENSVVISDDRRYLLEEIESRRKYLGGQCYAEAFIEGREFNLSLLASNRGPEILPPAEIKFANKMPGKINIVGYRAKWHADSLEYICTNRTFDFPDDDQPLLKHLQAIAALCWQLFSLRGYARVDFRVDSAGLPWVLEVNANPCLSPDGGFAATLNRAGLSFNQAIERIINDTITRY